MLCVAIDWASDHHDVGLTNDSAETLAAFRIAYGSEGFERLHRVVSKAKTDSWHTCCGPNATGSNPWSCCQNIIGS